jgi:hypothetical protein
LTHVGGAQCAGVVVGQDDMHWKAETCIYPPYLRTRIRRGRGVGSGISYIPWLKVRDVPSRGTSSVISGIITGRSHHLLSELEATYFYLLERRSSTLDILEQWPILDIDRTLELCAETQTRHNCRGIFPEPFTIDFLITERTAAGTLVRAASIKAKEDAENPAVRKRLSIECTWCNERGIPWTLVDTSGFEKILLANLRFMRGWFRNEFEPNEELVFMFNQDFSLVYTRNVRLSELIRQTAKRLRLLESVAQDIFRYCAWYDMIPVSLKHPISLGSPLVLRSTQ